MFIQVNSRTAFFLLLLYHLNILFHKVWRVDIAECLAGIDCFNEELVFGFPLVEGS
jgi:hypothetical protein